jgi:hypothetical protein
MKPVEIFGELKAKIEDGLENGCESVSLLKH